MNAGNVSHHWETSVAIGEPRIIVNDDILLDEMRDIIKRYVAEYQASSLTPISRQHWRGEFEKLRDQLADPLLKEYSSFEFMEKLYLQECSLAV